MGVRTETGSGIDEGRRRNDGQIGTDRSALLKSQQRFTLDVFTNLLQH